MLATADSTALALEVDGVSEALAPEALVEFGEALLLAEADCADASCGLDRATSLFRADFAADCVEAKTIFWLVSARACPLSTLAPAVKTDGASELFTPVAPAALDMVALWAEADCAAVSCGVLRAAFIPDACCATDCVEAGIMRWLVSARASPASTFAAAGETDGLNELVAPAALPAALGVLALAAKAECSAACCGLLRSALFPDIDCAADCAEAAAIGVSRMEERIS